MSAAENTYWSIEACAWVRSPRPEVDVPAPRPAEEVDEAVDPGGDQPSGLPL